MIAKYLRTTLVGLALAFGVLGLVPTAQAAAWNPFGDIDCSGKAAQSAVCQDKNKTEDPVTGRNGLIMKIVNIIAYATGVIAIIIIILAGLRFVTAGGGTEDVSAARRTLIYSVVGLIVIVLARTIVAFVLSKI